MARRLMRRLDRNRDAVEAAQPSFGFEVLCQPAGRFAPEEQVLRRRAQLDDLASAQALRIDAEHLARDSIGATTRKLAASINQTASSMPSINPAAKWTPRAPCPPTCWEPSCRRVSGFSCGFEEVGHAKTRRQAVHRLRRQRRGTQAAANAQIGRAFEVHHRASSSGRDGSNTVTRGLSGRAEFTLTTMPYRSSVNCTTDPGGYTPIILMKH